ncbi:GGDEF domain-containing protein [Natronohydrobacter thiooxidans]|jgi:diguanylate cyclase (GGDEF)-like protein|uniref:GGDEF domain-containing protein n=1 Tax=Natronohydrobacter thiooxidans TaxID=87172 RepID=UPI0008FF3A73|nr:GGDEF domain-containing protein [Natronohydrobacter thiooxidans]
MSEPSSLKPARTLLSVTDPMSSQYDTILYLVRQTTGADLVQIQIDGMPPEPVPADLQCLQVPLIHQGRRIGVLRAYGREFVSGAAHLLAGFAVLVVEQHALWSLAQLDMLTGAMTRRAFMSELGNAVATWSRAGTPCSLIAFDLDHFKAINDTYGHGAGDKVLRTVASMVRSELRPCDRLGRLGGEEFGVLVIADAGAALDIAERLRAVIEGTHLREHPEISFTSSFGVASCGEAAESRDTLISAADARLYEAKAQGRNRVVGAPGLVSAAAFG